MPGRNDGPTKSSGPKRDSTGASAQLPKEILDALAFGYIRGRENNKENDKELELESVAPASNRETIQDREDHVAIVVAQYIWDSDDTIDTGLSPEKTGRFHSVGRWSAIAKDIVEDLQRGRTLKPAYPGLKLSEVNIDVRHAHYKKSIGQFIGFLVGKLS